MLAEFRLPALSPEAGGCVAEGRWMPDMSPVRAGGSVFDAEQTLHLPGTRHVMSARRPLLQQHCGASGLNAQFREESEFTRVTLTA